MSPNIARREFLRQLLMSAGGLTLGSKLSRCNPLPGSGSSVSLTLLHINDLHGALQTRSTNDGTRGGAANLVGWIDQIRTSAPGPALLLDAGDAFQGTLISNSNHGQAVVEIMNAAGVNALTLGNHEFDWGLDVLRERIQQASFPFLAANLETESGQALEGISPYTVLNADGIRVGVLGLTYHDLSTIVRASSLEGLRSLPPAQTARQYLPELRQACDLVIVLSHLGFEEDQELARAVPEIPIIIGGHSHRVVHGGFKVGSTWIVQAGAYGEYLGKLALSFDVQNRQLVDDSIDCTVSEVTEAVTANPQVEAIVQKWAGEVDKIGAQVIGEAAIPLTKGSGTETVLGNLITDAMRATDLGDGRTFDVALHNDGGIRTNLDAGPITFGELYAVLPFDNNLVGLDLTGKQIRAMLEDGITSRASDIQVSGLTFVYTMSKSKGQRIVEVSIQGNPLDEERIYRVVTIDYLYTHPQYSGSLGKGTRVSFGSLCLDAVREYIRAHSPVHPKLEQRIRRE